MASAGVVADRYPSHPAFWPQADLKFTPDWEKRPLLSNGKWCFPEIIFLLTVLWTADCAERAVLARGWPGLAKREKRGKRTRILEFPVTEKREIAGLRNMARKRLEKALGFGRGHQRKGAKVRRR